MRNSRNSSSEAFRSMYADSDGAVVGLGRARRRALPRHDEGVSGAPPPRRVLPASLPRAWSETQAAAGSIPDPERHLPGRGNEARSRGIARAGGRHPRAARSRSRHLGSTGLGCSEHSCSINSAVIGPRALGMLGLAVAIAPLFGVLGPPLGGERRVEPQPHPICSNGKTGPRQSSPCTASRILQSAVRYRET